MIIELVPTLSMLEAEAVVRVLLGLAGQAVPAGAVLEVMQAKPGQPGQQILAGVAAVEPQEINRPEARVVPVL